MESAFIALQSVFWTIAVIVVALIGGVLGRWRGGGQPDGWGKYMPRPVDQVLCSAPYIALAFLVFPTWTASVLSVLTVLAVCKGHGRNMDLGTSDATHPNAELEWYEGLIGGLYGKISNYWYDALGLAVSGLTYTVPVGLFLADPVYGHPVLGWALALSGVVKAPGYMLAKLLCDKWPEAFDLSDTRVYSRGLRLREFTSWGELLSWFFLWLSALPILVFIAKSKGFL